MLAPGLKCWSPSNSITMATMFCVRRHILVMCKIEAPMACLTAAIQSIVLTIAPGHRNWLDMLAKGNMTFSLSPSVFYRICSTIDSICFLWQTSVMNECVRMPWLYQKSIWRLPNIAYDLVNHNQGFVGNLAVFTKIIINVPFLSRKNLIQGAYKNT